MSDERWVTVRELPGIYEVSRCDCEENVEPRRMSRRSSRMNSYRVEWENRDTESSGYVLLSAKDVDDAVRLYKMGCVDEDQAKGIIVAMTENGKTVDCFPRELGGGVIPESEVTFVCECGRVRVGPGECVCGL